MSAFPHAYLALLGSLTPFLHLGLHLAALLFKVHTHTLLFLTNPIDTIGLLPIIDRYGKLSVLGHELSFAETILFPLVLLLLHINETLVLKLQ